MVTSSLAEHFDCLGDVRVGGLWPSAFCRPSVGLSGLHLALKLAVTPGMVCLMVQPHTLVFRSCFVGEGFKVHTTNRIPEWRRVVRLAFKI